MKFIYVIIILTLLFIVLAANRPHISNNPPAICLQDDFIGMALNLTGNDILIEPIGIYKNELVARAKSRFNPESPFQISISFIQIKNNRLLQLTIPHIARVRPGDPFHEYLCKYGYPLICGRVDFDNEKISLQLECAVDSCGDPMISQLIEYAVNQADKIRYAHLFSFLIDCGVDASKAKRIISEIETNELKSKPDNANLMDINNI